VAPRVNCETSQSSVTKVISQIFQQNLRLPVNWLEIFIDHTIQLNILKSAPDV
jgi:hypothetical protein